jgi:hypothetical protein
MEELELASWNEVERTMANASAVEGWRGAWGQAEEEARNKQEEVLRSMIDFLQTKQQQMMNMKIGQHKISERRMSISGCGEDTKKFPSSGDEHLLKEEPIFEEEEEEVELTEEERAKIEQLQKVELLVRRMSAQYEETVNTSAPRVAPTKQDVKASSRMKPLRR